MNCAKNSQCVHNGTTSGGICIVGFGNRQRRDDGIGPFIVERLKAMNTMPEKLRFMVAPQLTLDLVDDLRSADAIFFVDATISPLEKGWRFEKIVAESRMSHFQTHHLSPAFLMGLLETLFNRKPMSMLVSVQGEDFGFDEGVTTLARKRADEAVSQIVEAVLRIHEKE